MNNLNYALPYALYGDTREACCYHYSIFDINLNIVGRIGYRNSNDSRQTSIDSDNTYSYYIFM